nr:hypothetical protein [Prosthecochloris sp. SCSIO W1101]
MGELVQVTGISIYAFALKTHHVHILLEEEVCFDKMVAYIKHKSDKQRYRGSVQQSENYRDFFAFRWQKRELPAI